MDISISPSVGIGVSLQLQAVLLLKEASTKIKFPERSIDVTLKSVVGGNNLDSKFLFILLPFQYQLESFNSAVTLDLLELKPFI